MQYKAALVTGGARRLGRAMVLALAKRGVDVALHYSGAADEAAQTVAEAQAFGITAVALQADLLEMTQVETLVGRAAAALGRPLDVLINNASIFEYDRLETATVDGWDRHMNSNLRAPLFLTQAFGAQVPKAQIDAAGETVASSVVINMVDQRVRKLTPEFMTYTLAKMGLWALTQTTARALAPVTRVNAIGPGPTLIGSRQSVQHFENQRKATILNRGANADEVVAAMNYLLDSAATTGQLLCVDGGQHLGWKTLDIQCVE
jgi:NAD(P)-dependent dehydrogenase (short-subunit alcohol dehydrogenase family)